MENKRCDNHGAVKHTSHRHTAHHQYDMHGKPLCQHGPIHRIYDVTVRTGLLSALASRKKAFRNPYIHDHNRDHISLDGKLVSPSVLHICRYNMRMHSMERRFFEEGKTSYSFVDRSQPHV